MLRRAAVCAAVLLLSQRSRCSVLAVGMQLGGVCPSLNPRVQRHGQDARESPGARTVGLPSPPSPPPGGLGTWAVGFLIAALPFLEFHRKGVT